VKTQAKTLERILVQKYIFNLSAFFHNLLSCELMSAYFFPHSVFNFGYLIEFMCLKSDLIDNSDN